MKTDIRLPDTAPPSSGDADSSNWLITFVFNPPAEKYFGSDEQLAAARKVGAGWWSYTSKDCDVLFCDERGTRPEAVSDACMRIAPLLGHLIAVHEIQAVHAFHEGEAELNLALNMDLTEHDVTQEAIICLGKGDLL